MNTCTKFLSAASAIALATFLPGARAQLLLSGSTHGQFVDPGLAHTTVTNSATVSEFASGVPYRSSDTQTSVTFTGADFSGAGNGATINLGTVDVTNGITRIGSTAGFADMTLYLDVTSPQNVANYVASTLHFTIDNTINNQAFKNPDLFHVGIAAADPLTIGNMRITFGVQPSNLAFSNDGGASVAEGTSASFDLYAYVTTFSPVPEPSTYALWGAVLLVGVIALRRFRSRERVA